MKKDEPNSAHAHEYFTGQLHYIDKEVVLLNDNFLFDSIRGLVFDMVALFLRYSSPQQMTIVQPDNCCADEDMRAQICDCIILCILVTRSNYLFCYNNLIQYFLGR